MNQRSLKRDDERIDIARIRRTAELVHAKDVDRMWSLGPSCGESEDAHELARFVLRILPSLTVERDILDLSVTIRMSRLMFRDRDEYNQAANFVARQVAEALLHADKEAS